MHFPILTSAFTLLSLSLALCTTAQNVSTNAPVVTDNEPVSVHHASLLAKDNTTVYGGITITSRLSSPALAVDVYIGGIPEGQYLNYHIHRAPVPADGNCYSTGAHLDPYNRTQKPPCNSTAPNTCEVGDLSGKHGVVWAPAGEVFRASYSEFFLANTPGAEAYFGDLSWVVHAPNNDRLTCGNFEVAVPAGGAGDYDEDEVDEVVAEGRA
ncbi:superoxide dismutase [Aspergillus multicolor]|uniref:putative cytosolic Cu/Zn superoxide dismutase n=1 Tax=Aspergillus multicolor TaxID=41759 RepID=UPI003CCD3AC4